VVGAAIAGRRAGIDRLIGFDMGGTSADVARCDGEFEYDFEHAVGPVRLVAPALAIETVAAGGGSICRLDQGKLTVGPQSAGAEPGPACYGMGGPLTLTDGLVAFGGAGGQHACRIAELLGMSDVVLPADAGLLSAHGLGYAAFERFAQREVLRPLHDVASRIDGWMAELEAEASRALAAEGVTLDDLGTPRLIVQLRYAGQDASLEIEPPPGADLAAEFERQYFELFSHRPPDRDIELVSLRVVVRSLREDLPEPAGTTGPPRTRSQPTSSQRCFIDGSWREVPCLDTGEMAEGAALDGPALILQRHSVLVMPSGWRAERVGFGSIRVRRNRAADCDESESPSHGRHPLAVELELMSHRFASVAREMGELLRRTAISTNIKEREDFSCTLLDPAGRLVVNAPHIPVHLGAMGLCVRALADSCVMVPNDVVVTNHPAYGGSHLPDVTLAAPVHLDRRLLGYVACRAHHAEIGGIRPGSVPPNARSLAEEGVVIPPTLLVEGGRPRWRCIEELLKSGPYPTRALADNLADLRAMLAAINRGRVGLARLARSVGIDHVLEHMEALRRHADRLVRHALNRLPDGAHGGRQQLDDGSELVAAFRIDGDRAVLDLEGTAGVHPGNLNATPAIVASATMYVLRLLVDAELPLNEGLLEPVELRIPKGLLDPGFGDDPTLCPAVVGGNVETSQRLVDTLLEALRLAACSQGTMNNLSFGDSRFGYYETVAGGSGAGDGFDGADGVHTHMTNTAATDPEVLEHRYPVRLHRFAIRRGSGGAGRWRGGDGLIRELEFLAPLELSILSQHRVAAPYGAAGAADGAPGRQTVVRRDGTRLTLEGIDGCLVETGDRLVLETPGGGGWGEPGQRR
jgi:5-oxoprolinase (ATP-hydrolysing)